MAYSGAPNVIIGVRPNWTPFNADYLILDDIVKNEKPRK